jgi:hypothetical protein
VRRISPALVITCCATRAAQVRDKDQLAALRKRTELAVDEARQDAQAGCAAQHRLRRCWAADKLQAIHAWLRTNLSWLPVQLPMVLALVSYARSEALWLFQHLSHGAAGSDLEAAVLLAAIEDMRAVLVSKLPMLQHAAICDVPHSCTSAVWTRSDRLVALCDSLMPMAHAMPVAVDGQ